MVKNHKKVAADRSSTIKSSEKVYVRVVIDLRNIFSDHMEWLNLVREVMFIIFRKISKISTNSR